ncbi:OTU deubiquitinase 3 L homeolog isoform X1 [Xenopus laevis]|uniref:OTU domain-containing protein 3 n=1 Tax=Xenopus laevis TaxID=8355 RepID=A0A8J1LBX9_XENLA|nr:OTU deubiquitinase 3 L homeolog isoform X1 [Xenopus laevis]
METKKTWNCLFRALGDQLEGHSRNHLRHRQETVDYVIKHRNDFEPFVEDDVPFDRHVANLAKSGTFAGNDAIVAFARNNQVNVVIHQLNNPLWQIRGSDKVDSRELHIAYRYGEHYDSVRHINDNAEVPANLQTEMLSKDKANQRQKPNVLDERLKLHNDAVQKVRNATGCADVRLILQSLEAESYDVDSAIHSILQELRLIDEDSAADVSHCHCPSASLDSRQYGRSESLGQEQMLNTNLDAAEPQTGEAETKPDLSDETRVDLRNNVQENTASKDQQKLSNKQRKDQQRQEKKKRQEERHRQKVQEGRGKVAQNNRQETENSQVTMVKAFEALNI